MIDLYALLMPISMNLIVALDVKKEQKKLNVHSKGRGG
jgi:hypothetical protein